ncbi:MAG: hypothetical protein JSW33_08020 [bacterium]|nr:MAG: hypothetical protein JSW33_08020 [bacterium]
MRNEPARFCLLSAFLIFHVLFFVLFQAGITQKFDFTIDEEDVLCCSESGIRAIVWHGNDTKMTIQKLASYCAPVLWFSPDEPLLLDTEGPDILLPEPFPFEDDPRQPVVYYRLRTILHRADADGPAYFPDLSDKNQSIIDLKQAAGIDIDFFFYYHAEEGLGGHQHDVEFAEFQIIVWPRPNCEQCQYHLIVTKVTGKAHGLSWYDNTLGVDEYTNFPMHILVEEGKHASCTDKNGDGYYTPGYDVNRRVNDAWAVRDVIRGGALFTGGFEAWMAKVRRPEHRVFPPLPIDSPLREKYSENGIYAPENAIYELRPFPHIDKVPSDLYRFFADKGDPEWPVIVTSTTFEEFKRWTDTENFVKSLSISLYADGDLGVSFVFPLFIFKNFEDPMAGGFLVNRVILKDKKFRDISWMLLYTRSASRWIDGYLSAGVEWDKIDLPEIGPGVTELKTDFVFETGIKFRALLTHTPFKFMTKLTDFWGFRAGIKNKGFWNVKDITYVLEVGAGTW